MTDLLRALLDFTDRTRLPALLAASGYWTDSKQFSDSWTAFQRELSPEQGTRLEALLEQATALHIKDAEAVFQCGLSLGLELGRL